MILDRAPNSKASSENQPMKGRPLSTATNCEVVRTSKLLARL
jgi:hypothetical protein